MRLCREILMRNVHVVTGEDKCVLLDGDIFKQPPTTTPIADSVAVGVKKYAFDGNTCTIRLTGKQIVVKESCNCLSIRFDRRQADRLILAVGLQTSCINRDICSIRWTAASFP